MKQRFLSKVGMEVMVVPRSGEQNIFNSVDLMEVLAGAGEALL
jgi:hypothetical protein